MINLFINYYADRSEARQEELDSCLANNIVHPLIDRIIVFYDGDTIPLKKVITLPQESRPTFSDMFRMTQYFPDDINIIANSDIYFDETLQHVIEYNWTGNICMALARWDKQPDGSLVHFNMPDTMDSWIFKGAAPQIPDADFTLGVLGCDNKIAWLLREHGYYVINPSVTIRTIHLHNSGVRNYTVETRLPPPYHLIQPHTL